MAMDVKEAGRKGGQTHSSRRTKKWFSENGKKAALARWAKGKPRKKAGLQVPKAREEKAPSGKPVGARS